MSRGLWLALLVSRMLLCEAAGQCETSIAGMALKGHTFKTLEVRRPDECYFRCGEEDACQSFNYYIPNKICELKDQTKDSRPLHVIPDRDRFYMTHVENKEKWQKINSEPVCFGARNDKYGEFTITKSGRIATFKLLHKNGSVSCNTGFPSSYWGCISGRRKLATVITFTNKTVFLPAIKPTPSKYMYFIDGVDISSSELEFDRLVIPLSVSRGQNFQIWYEQDWRDYNEDNNGGETCLDVYAWYA